MNLKIPNDILIALSGLARSQNITIEEALRQSVKDNIFYREEVQRGTRIYLKRIDGISREVIYKLSKPQ